MEDSPYAHFRRPLDAGEEGRLVCEVLGAYRWQFILSGAADVRFREVLESLVTPAQAGRIDAAIAPLGD